VLRNPIAGQLYIDGSPIGTQIDWNQSVTALQGTPKIDALLDSFSGRTLTDADVDFIAAGVVVGDTVYNIDEEIFAEVVSVDSTTQLTLSEQFVENTSLSHAYRIYETPLPPVGYEVTDGDEASGDNTFLAGQKKPHILPLEDFFSHGHGIPVDDTMELMLDGISEGVTSKGKDPDSFENMQRQEFINDADKELYSNPGFTPIPFYEIAGSHNAYVPELLDKYSSPTVNVRNVGESGYGFDWYECEIASVTLTYTRLEIPMYFLAGDYRIHSFFKQQTGLPGTGHTRVEIGVGTVAYEHVSQSVTSGQKEPTLSIETSSDPTNNIIYAVGDTFNIPTAASYTLYVYLGDDAASSVRQIGQKFYFGGISITPETMWFILPKRGGVRNRTKWSYFTEDLTNGLVTLDFKAKFGASSNGYLNVNGAEISPYWWTGSTNVMKIDYRDSAGNNYEVQLDWSPNSDSRLEIFHAFRLVLNFNDPSLTRLWVDGVEVLISASTDNTVSAIISSDSIFYLNEANTVFGWITDFVYRANVADVANLITNKVHYDPKKLIGKDYNFSIDSKGNIFARQIRSILESEDLGIADFGTNVNGSYLILSNGLKIIFGRHNFPASITTTLFTYPIEFEQETIAMIVQPDGNSGDLGTFNTQNVLLTSTEVNRSPAVGADTKLFWLGVGF
jgi:hypothetical protein